MSRYTDEEKAAALALYRSVGATEAARQTGIPKGTLGSWANRAGVKTSVAVPPQVAAAQATHAALAETRRLQLAETMGQRAQVILDHMDEVLAKAVGVEVVTAADVKNLAQAVSTLVEKMQLLTGEATSRDDHTGGLDLEAELRQHQAAMAEQRAMDAARAAL